MGLPGSKNPPDEPGPCPGEIPGNGDNGKRYRRPSPRRACLLARETAGDYFGGNYDVEMFALRIRVG
jgi:hypothetical protein